MAYMQSDIKQSGIADKAVSKTEQAEKILKKEPEPVAPV